MQQDHIEQVVTVARGTDVEKTILPSGVAKSLGPPRFQASPCRAGTVRDKAMSRRPLWHAGLPSAWRVAISFAEESGCSWTNLAYPVSTWPRAHPCRVHQRVLVCIGTVVAVIGADHPVPASSLGSQSNPEVSNWVLWSACVTAPTTWPVSMCASSLNASAP